MNNHNLPPAQSETRGQSVGGRPRFSILHTSARPNAWKAVYDAWLKNADRIDDVEYILVVDERWGFCAPTFVNEGETRTVRMPREEDKIIYNTGRRCYVEGVNLAAKHANGDILIVVADDQFPCEHWDSQLNSTLGLKLKSSEFVCWAPTGTPAEFERSIIVMPIMSRALYEKWGYVMYPGYESMYADNDLCEHAKAEGVLIEARHLPVFPHRHPLFNDKGEWRKSREQVLAAGYDAAYEAQNRKEAYSIGEQLLARRRANGFKDVNLSGPPTPIRSAAPQSAGGKKSICVCLPGETFSRPWVMNWTSLLAVLSRHFTLFPPIFGYSSSPDVTRQGFRNEVLKGELPDYVLWLDDDNILTPDGLLQLVADLEEHPEISLAAGWSWCADGRSITAGLMLPNGHCGRIDYKTLNEGPHDLFRVQWTGFPAVLMRGALLQEAGPKAFIKMPNDLEPWFCYGEDISFCLNVAHRLLVIDRRVRVPHLKLADNQPDLALKTAASDSTQVSLEAAHEVLEPAGIPA